MNTNKNFDFENSFNRFEKIIELIDDSDLPLDELIERYEEGMELSVSLRNFLEKAEQRIIDISKNPTADNPITDDDENKSKRPKKKNDKAGLF